MTTIALIEPNTIQREGMFAILNRVVDFSIVGLDKTIASSQITFYQQQPQIFLIDFSCLFNSDKRIDKKWLSVAEKAQIIVINAEVTSNYLFEMINIGICGALNKSVSESDLVCSIRRVAKGEILFNHYQFIQSRLWSENVVKKWEALTTRERQILQSIVRGVGNKTSAQEYVISQKTVAFHVTNILQKLNVSSRQEAALWVNKNINR